MPLHFGPNKASWYMCIAHREDTHWGPSSGVQGGLCFWALRVWKNWRCCSWQTTSLGALYSQKTSVYLSLSSENGLPTKSGASVWGIAFRFVTHLGSMEMLSENISWGATIYLWALTTPCYSLPVPPGKKPKYLSKASNFAIVTKGIPPDHLVWRPSRSVTAVP